MIKPRAHVYKEGYIPNHVSEDYRTATLAKPVYKNYRPVDFSRYDAFMANNAQEQAYWVQLGTATFQLNERYHDGGLEVTGSDPFHPTAGRPPR